MATIVVGLEVVLRKTCKVMDTIDRRHKEGIVAAKVEVANSLHKEKDEMDIVDMVLDTNTYAEDDRNSFRIDIEKDLDPSLVVDIGN